MYLKDFAKNICFEGTASENRLIKVVIEDGRSFVVTAKELDGYCKTYELLREINGIKFPHGLSRFLVVKFNPIILTEKDKEVPECNRSIQVEIV